MHEHTQIQLQSQTAETVTQFWHATKDPLISRYLPLEEHDLSSTLERWQTRCRNETAGFGRAIFVNNAYIGDAWCFCDRDDVRLVFVNIAIVKPEFWGKGIGSTALGEFCKQVKAIVPSCTLAAFIYEDNPASMRCFERNGFVKDEEIIEDGRRSFLLKVH